MYATYVMYDHPCYCCKEAYYHCYIRSFLLKLLYEGAIDGQSNQYDIIWQGERETSTQTYVISELPVGT